MTVLADGLAEDLDADADLPVPGSLGLQEVLDQDPAHLLDRRWIHLG